MYAPTEICRICHDTKEVKAPCRNVLCGSHSYVDISVKAGLNQSVLRLDIYLDLTKLTDADIRKQIDLCFKQCEADLPIIKRGILESEQTGKRYGYSEHRDDRHYDILLKRGDIN